MISLGIYIFQQANGVISGSGMTKAEISSFNQQFTKYEGTKTGSEIRALVQEVIANNSSADASDETQVELTGIVTLKAGDAKPTYGTLKNTKYYDVEVSEYQSSGRVKTISISDHK